MTIPKIIWTLWCDFNNKADGILDQRLTYFKNRIIHQHPEWEINIITSWRKLIQYIKDEKVLLDVVNNPIIGGAHKADSVRFFLLKKFGGFWLDISTFLFVPLDIYYEKQPDAKFIGYFTPPFMVEDIIFNSLGDMFDSVQFNKIVEKFKPNQSEYIKLNDNYKDFPFIPENFFIAAEPNNEIINDVFQQLMTFWRDAIPFIKDKETLCYQINLLMNDIAKEIFKINYLDYELTQIYESSDITNNAFIKKALDNVWHCGYVFNYLQMYIAIIKYIKNNNLALSQESNPTEFQSKYNNDLCSIDGRINACQNIVGTNKINNQNVLYLLSLSYNRLIKWENTLDDRISFDNTYIKNLIDSLGKTPGLTPEKIIEHLSNMGIYQIKFSSWTRKSNIIEKFMELYPNEPGQGPTSLPASTASAQPVPNPLPAPTALLDVASTAVPSSIEASKLGGKIKKKKYGKNTQKYKKTYKKRYTKKHRKI
jgi:hypothetical protein